MIQNYEKLGAFYLGKEYDPATRKLKEDLILYDSKDLNPRRHHRHDRQW